MLAFLVLSAHADPLTCRDPADCPPDYGCEGVCVLPEPGECAIEDDCPLGETCLEGTCVAAGPGAPSFGCDRLALVWVHRCSGLVCGWSVEIQCVSRLPPCSPRGCIT